MEFALTVDPKYFFTMTFSGSIDTKVEKRFLFMDKLASFRKDKTRKSIGLSSFRSLSTTSSEAQYFNCSMKYSPCNLNEFKKMKAEYSDANDFPTSAFRNAMMPEIEIELVYGTFVTPCGDPYPPVVVIKPPTLNISLCGMTRYIIPEGTFYDTDQGSTRNLDLALTMKTQSTFQMSSFVQFSVSKQQLLIIPSAAVLRAQNSRSFQFSLIATDNTKLQAVTDMIINVFGPYSILEECQIQITLTRVANAQTTRTQIETMQYIIRQLSSYFQVSVEEIGVVQFTQVSSTTVMFAWSYCSALYRTSAYFTNQAGLAVDYYNFQMKILMRLFDSKRQVNSVFFTVFANEYNVIKVETKFTGRCRDLPPIVTPGHAEIVITLQYGGFATYTYLDNYFYDFEDGGAYSLTISFLSSMNTSLLIDYWINIDIAQHTIYAIVTDLVRATSSSSSMFRYNLIAKDSAGQSAIIIVRVIKYTTILKFAPFNITYALQYNGQSGIIYARQAKYLVEVIRNYFTSVTSYSQVLVRWYYQAAGYPQYRIFIFSIANHDCASQVLQKIKTAYTSQG